MTLEKIITALRRRNEKTTAQQKAQLKALTADMQKARIILLTLPRAPCVTKRQWGRLYKIQEGLSKLCTELKAQTDKEI